MNVKVSMTFFLRSISKLCALTVLLCGAGPVSAAEAVLELDFTTEAGAARDGVRIENYRFTGKDGAGMLSLKPYEASLLERPRRVQGTVTTKFAGAEGWYTVLVEYQDESDGTSRFELRVNGERVRSWKADSIIATYLATERMPHVKLSPGDELQVMGEVGGTEYARLQSIRVLPGEPPEGQGHELAIPDRLWSTDLVRLGDYGDDPAPERLIPAAQDAWGKGRKTVYYFRADEAGTFTAYAQPSSGNQKAAGEYAFTQVLPTAESPASGLKPAGRFESPEVGEPALVEFAIPRPGLYELHVQGGIQQVTHPLTRRIGSHAIGQGFFLVPGGTSAILVKGRVNGDYVTQAAIKNPAGEIVWQGEIADDGERVVMIPERYRGLPWYIEYSGVGGTSLWIEGVPPYLALHRADLLLPREALIGAGAGYREPGEKGRLQHRPAGNAMTDSGRPGLDPAATAADAAKLTLVRDGKPRAVIIAPAGRTTLAGEAAALLQRNLKQISGAELPVQDGEQAVGEESVRILVGTPDDFPGVSLPEGFAKLNEGGFLLRTDSQDSGRVLIIGRRPEAVQHAVATFLQKLGCRWYYPAEAWHVIPQAATIDVALDDLQEPSFIRRTIGYRSRDRGRFEKWAVFNRLGSTIDGHIHHSYANFVPRGLYGEHPEYFALKDTDDDGVGDTRTPNQPCTTHPAVVEMFRQKAVRAFEQNPGMDMLPVCPNDGTPNMCRCERCRAVGSFSDCMWLIAHQVADAVDEKFDGKKIAIMAYGRPSPPPTIDQPRDDRLVAELATAYLYRTSLKEMLAGWPKAVGLLTIYDYWAIPQWGSNNPGGHFDVQEARTDLPYFHRQGARGITGEAAGSWGSTGLAMYVAAELMWDVDADVDAIVERYYRDCFGKAAEAVRAYEERWQNGAEFNDRTLKLALLDLQRGMKLAEHWSQKRRIASLVLYMHALKVRRDFAELGKQKSKQDAAAIARMVEAGDSFLWRSQDVGLYHMSHGIGGVTQNGFMWFTQDEVEALVARDLEDLQDAPAVEMRSKFSDDLVRLPVSVRRGQPADEDEQSESAESRLLPKRSHVLIQVEAQEPVRLTLHQGSNPNAPQKVTVSLVRWNAEQKSDEAVPAAGEQEVDFGSGKEQHVRLTVKEAGLYRIRRSSAEHRYRIHSSQPWVIDLSREAKPETWLEARDEPWYFFVPEGVELFELYGGGGNEKPLQIRVADSSGKTVVDETVQRSGRVQVRVPDDQRNTVWSFRLKYFVGLYGNWIQGVPPYISSSPERLLVPRELVEEGSEGREPGVEER